MEETVKAFFAAWGNTSLEEVMKHVTINELYEFFEYRMKYMEDGE